MKCEDGGLTHIAQSLSVVIKEISRRAELRPRFEAEKGRRLTDEEFLSIAERTGMRF